jgi:hypothetical protein
MRASYKGSTSAFQADDGGSNPLARSNAGVAQWQRHSVQNADSGGSNPLSGTTREPE